MIGATQVRAALDHLESALRPLDLLDKLAESDEARRAVLLLTLRLLATVAELTDATVISTTVDTAACVGSDSSAKWN